MAWDYSKAKMGLYTSDPVKKVVVNALQEIRPSIKKHRITRDRYRTYALWIDRESCAMFHKRAGDKNWQKILRRG